MTKKSDELETPYPSSPKLPPLYVVRFRWPGDMDRDMIKTYRSAYAAKKEIEHVIGEQKFSWSSDIQIITPTHAILSEQLKDIMNHEYSDKEFEWQIPRPDIDLLDYFIAERTDPETKPVIQPTSSPKKHRRDSSGFITSGEMAAELEITGLELRRALRKVFPQKPQEGWAFKIEEWPEIKKKIQEVI